MRILTLNAGSNSLKFEIIEEHRSRHHRNGDGFGKVILAGSYDDIGKAAAKFSLLDGKRPKKEQRLEIRDHKHAATLLLDWLQQGHGSDNGVASLNDIQYIAHRIVHGADLFDAHVEITPGVLRQIESIAPLAPLHNASSLDVIRVCQELLGSQKRMIAVFDTVFHRSIPKHAALYPLPPKLASQYRIRRYGFHGISHKYLMLRYAQLTGRPANESTLITAHLEGGSSVCAIHRGVSVDTSMGFTPLEGLMMGTRCGDIDAAAVAYLMQKEKMNAEEIIAFLNTGCGLKGVSGLSGDTRELAKHVGNAEVDLALEMFTYRVLKYVGAYLAALGGSEAIVLAGGIAENTPLVRQKICKSMAWCGATLDPSRNEEVVDCEGIITSPDSALKVWVIPTQEGLMMAQEAVATVTRLG